MYDVVFISLSIPEPALAQGFFLLSIHPFSRFLPFKGDFFLCHCCFLGGQALGFYKAPRNNFGCNRHHVNKDELN